MRIARGVDAVIDATNSPTIDEAGASDFYDGWPGLRPSS